MFGSSFDSFRDYKNCTKSYPRDIGKVRLVAVVGRKVNNQTIVNIDSLSEVTIYLDLVGGYCGVPTGSFPSVRRYFVFFAHKTCPKGLKAVWVHESTKYFGSCWNIPAAANQKPLNGESQLLNNRRAGKTRNY